MAKEYYMIIDLGGTKTTGALFDESGKPVDDFIHVVKSQTFQGEEAVYQNTKKVIDTVLTHHNIGAKDLKGIGIGAPGPLDTTTGEILHSPLMHWGNFPIVKRLENDYKVPAALDNDGNLGAYAEYKCGLGQGKDCVLYMTVSTGCGGGIVLNGRIYRGFMDRAGEFGHLSIDINGLECPCGSRGCFELYASGSAMNRRMKADMERGMKNATFERMKYNPENINGAVLFESARAGEQYALDAFKQEGFYLGAGIANLFNLLAPDMIILGGGVSKAKEFYREELMKVLRSRTMAEVPDGAVQFSVMNDYVVLYGAFYMIYEKTHNR